MSHKNRPFSFSEKGSQSNDVCLHFEEFSNVHNSDRSPNAIRSNFAYKKYKNLAQSRLFCRIAKRSIVPCFCGCCGGAAVDSIISDFTQVRATVSVEPPCMLLRICYAWYAKFLICLFESIWHRFFRRMVKDGFKVNQRG